MCTCDLEALQGSIYEGNVLEIEHLVKKAEECTAQKHNDTMRNKEKTYLVAHAKSWAGIQKVLDLSQFAFGDYMHAICVWDEQKYLPQLYQLRPKEYIEFLLTHVRLDRLDGVQLFVDPIRNEIRSSEINELLQEAHPMFKPELEAYFQNVTAVESK